MTDFASNSIPTSKAMASLAELAEAATTAMRKGARFAQVLFIAIIILAFVVSRTLQGALFPALIMLIAFWCVSRAAMTHFSAQGINYIRGGQPRQLQWEDVISCTPSHLVVNLVGRNGERVNICTMVANDAGAVMRLLAAALPPEVSGLGSAR